MRAAPSVSVVIATRDRPELLRAAVSAALAQDYEGAVEVIAVFDQGEPNPSMERSSETRSVRAIPNTRKPGLAGARNSGVVAARGDVIAFCDDDDVWMPHKLSAQVRAMRRTGVIAAVAGIEIVYGDGVHHRVPATDLIAADDLTRSRLTGAHPSTYVIRKDMLTGAVGLVDEDIPGGYGEDYDLLLRLARHGQVAVVREPLARVLWHRGSYFSRRWEAMASGIGYLLTKHPELRSDRTGHAWLSGQRAFALAALHDRGAVRAALHALRLNPREPRGWLALLVSARILSAPRVMRALNSRGRGI